MGAIASLVQGTLAITILVDGILLVLVYRGREQGLLRSLFLIHLVGILGWALSVLLVIRTEHEFAAQATFATALILAVSKYYFVLAFPDNVLSRGWKTALPLLIAIGAFIICFIPSALFTEITVIDQAYILVENGTLSFLYLPVIVFFLFAPITILYRKYRTEAYQGIVKEQIRYVLWGVAIFFIIGLLTNSLLPVVFHIYLFNGLGPSFSLILAGFIIYTISKHHFLDLRLIVQRGLIYSLVLTSIVLCYLTTISGLGLFIHRATETAALVSAGITTILGIIAVPHIDRYLRKVTDAYFFKDRYDYAHALFELSEIANTHIIYKEIVAKAEDAIQRTFKTNEVSVSNKNVYAKVFDRSALSIPVVLHEKRLGYLSVGPKRSGDLYTAEDEALMKTFSRHLAVALEKARLYKEVEDYSHELEHRVSERTAEVLYLQESQRQMLLDIAHRLQSPLTVLKSELETAKKDSSPHGEILAVLDHTVDEVSSFTYNLLGLARLSMDGTGPRHDHNMSELVEELVEYYEVLARAKRIEVTASVTPNIHLSCNREQLSELITNLVSNSVKYMGPRRRGQKRSIEIALSKTADAIVCSVSDTGIGIEAEDLPKVFDRFYRAEREGTEQIGGTGLGLAIAKKITELHGGTIGIASTRAKGTCVTVTFRAANG